MRGLGSVRRSFSFCTRSARRRGRAHTVLATVGAMGAAALVMAQAPAQATQATGDDVVAWSNGWSWTYATTFNYDDGNGTRATINENVTYTVVGTQTFAGQDAYKVNLSGTITGGSGNANTGSFNASLDSFSGSVSGTEYVRRSDLALLQEEQHQNLNAKAHASIITVGVTATVDLTLTPNPGWRQHDFPLNPGDTWHSATSID